jgi:HEAT repeat protein
VQKLEDEELAQVPEVLRAVLNAVRNIKLYPLNSKNVSASIDQLYEALHALLDRRKTLVLAQVRGFLVVNGGKIDPQGIEPQVDGFLKFLDTNLLTSLTFLEGVTLQELKSFIGVLGQAPPGGSDSEFWPRVAKEERIKNLLFDQVFYETRVTPTEGFGDLDQPVEIVGVEGLDTELLEPIPEEQLDTFLHDLMAQVADLLADGKEKETLQLLRRLFVNFSDRTIVTREKMIESCRRMLEDLTPAQQNHFAKLLSHPLLGIFQEEKDPKITRDISSLLHRMSALLIQFLQHPLAGRILLNLQQRQRQLEEARDPHSQRLAKVLERKLDPGVQKLLLSDLNSEEPFRHQNAVLLLGSLGKAAIPLLLEAIKKTDDLRVRTLAASLLAKAGNDGVALVKKEAVLAGTAEERVRILDVIEVVTRDLKAELAYALGEENSKVRQAAFRLLERMNDSQAVELLLENVEGNEPRLALESMECLGRLKPAAAVRRLLSLLENQKKSDLLAACCRALGQIGDPACIEPLMKILTQHGLFARMKSGWAEVRATAAYALSQIPHPQAAEVLISLENDSDPRVREAAQKVLKSFHSQKPSPKPRSHPLRRDGSPAKPK